MNNNETIRNIIVNRRNELGMSLSEMARKLDIPKSTLSRYENLKHQYPLDEIQNFARVLGTSPEHILGFDEETQSLYNLDDFMEEVQKATENFTNEEKDGVLNYIYDVKAKKQRGTNPEINVLDLANSLSKTGVQAIDNLSNYIIRVSNNNGTIYQSAKELLKDCKIAIDNQKITTIEFINTKRKIYELLMPLGTFTNAYEQNIITIKGISDAMQLTREFVVESIGYYANSRGAIIEHDGFVIDFSNVPVEYNNIDELDSFELSITDTNEKRIELRNKKNKKMFKKTR